MQILKSHTQVNDYTQSARNIFINYASEADENPVTLRQYEVLQQIMVRWRVTPRLQCGAYLLLPFQRQFITNDQLAQLFTPQITKFLNLIHQLTNETKLAKPKLNKAASIDRLRRLLIYAYSDYEAALFAMAYHLAQGEIVEVLEDKQRESWLQNSEHIYLRLFQMFGLLFDGAALYRRFMKLREFERWQQLEKTDQIYKTDIAADLDSMRQKLGAELPKNNFGEIVIEQTPREFVLFHHSHHRQQFIDYQTFDLNSHRLYVDIYTQDYVTCYQILGVIHSLWRPKRQHLPKNNTQVLTNNSLQDYIARPRSNGYRALVTVVHFPAGKHIQTIEFSIQTNHFREVNEYGIIAARRQNEFIQNAWWSNTDLRKILQPISVENPGEEIAVFMSDGALLHPLRQGTTLLDIAFKIHSDLGIHASAFWLNGRSVDPSTQVQHYDFVEIDFDGENNYLKPEWEQIAFLRSTRRQIRQLLRQQIETPSNGRQLLDDVIARESQISGFYLPKERIEEGLTAIAARLGHPDINYLYTNIESGQYAPDRIAADLIEAEYIKHIILEDGSEVNVKQIRIVQTWMQESEPVRSSAASRVLPGVSIVGKYAGDPKTNLSTLFVYKKDSKQAPTGLDAVPLRWRSMTDLNEAIAITIKAQPHSHVSRMIFNNLYSASGDEKNNLVINKYEAEIRNNELHIEAIVYAPNSGTIQKIKTDLETTQRSHYIHDYKIWQLFPTHKMLVASIADRRLHNPYTIRDVRNTMFFGRDQEIQRIIDAINNNHPVVLYGQKRIGKTSLLNRLTEVLLPQHCNAIPVMLDVLSLMPFDTVSFLKELVQLAVPKIQSESRKQDRHDKRDNRNTHLPKFRLKSDEHPFKTFGEWVHQVEEHLAGKKLVFLVDEFTRAEEEYQQGALDQRFFQGLQWLVSTSGVSFIFCIHDHLITRENSSITGLLQRSDPIRVAELDKNNARRLIQQPLEDFYQWEEPVVDRMMRLTNGHPFYIQALCQELISSIAHTDTTVITPDHLEHAIRQVLRQGDHYFNHYRHRVQSQDWEILKVIAYITSPEHPWASSNKIRKAVSRYLPGFESLAISKSIGVLRIAGFLEAAEKNHQPTYSISMELFHQYLQRIVTHLTVSRDLQREE